MKTWAIVLVVLVVLWYMLRPTLHAVTANAYQVGNAATSVGASVANVTSLAGIGALIGGIIHTPSQPPAAAGSATSTAGVGDTSPVLNDESPDLVMH
jgi:hypothetical protein